MFYTASSGNGAVFLDLGEDEYYCAYSDERLDGYAKLSARSLDSDRSNSNVPLPERPWVTLPQLDQRPRLIDGIRFGAALIESWVVFHGANVRRLLRHVSGRNLPIADPQTAAKIAAICRVFFKMMPFKSQCLFRSFLLMNLLRRYGVTAEWVFGVHLFPFRAHCWVAVERWLLNERPHRIKDYQTIFILEKGDPWRII